MVSGEAPAESAPRGRSEAQRAPRGALRSIAVVDAPADVDPPASEREARHAMMLHSVTVTVSDHRCSVSVEVRSGAEQSVAVTEGPCAGGGLDRQVAEATVRAAGGLDPAAHRVAVEAIVVGPVGSRVVATAALAHPLGGGEEHLAGAAVVGPSGVVDAVARAVLEALAHRSASA